MAALTVDDRIDEIVAGLGVRFDGVRDGALIFVPLGIMNRDVDATLDAIIERLSGNPIMREIEGVESVELAA